MYVCMALVSAAANERLDSKRLDKSGVGSTCSEKPTCSTQRVSIKTLFRLYYGSIKTLFRLY